MIMSITRKQKIDRYSAPLQSCLGIPEQRVPLLPDFVNVYSSLRHGSSQALQPLIVHQDQKVQVRRRPWLSPQRQRPGTNDSVSDSRRSQALHHQPQNYGQLIVGNNVLAPSSTRPTTGIRQQITSRANAASQLPAALHSRLEKTPAWNPGANEAPSSIEQRIGETLRPPSAGTAFPSAPLSPGPAAAATAEPYEPAQISLFSD